MIKTLYAVPTYRCNLSCSHCAIKDMQANEDFEKFINALENLEFQHGVIFGGEPLLIQHDNLSRMFAVKNMNSISTNLLLLSRMHLEDFCKYGIDVATSWNPDRFDKIKYSRWLDNVKLLVSNKVHVTVLVTLTERLFKSNVEDVLEDLDCLDDQYFEGVRFEPYVQSDSKLVNESDLWLTALTERWHYSFANLLLEDYKKGNLHFCKDIWTLKPDSSLVNSCPMETPDCMIDDCLKCKYNKVCRPCKKQKVCSFLVNFKEKVQSLCQ